MTQDALQTPERVQTNRISAVSAPSTASSRLTRRARRIENSKTAIGADQQWRRGAAGLREWQFQHQGVSSQLSFSSSARVMSSRSRASIRRVGRLAFQAARSKTRQTCSWPKSRRAKRPPSHRHSHRRSHCHTRRATGRWMGNWREDPRRRPRSTDQSRIANR